MQPALFTEKSELEKKFNKFDEDNPNVYKALVKLTYDLKAQGHKKIGIKMLIEIVRWKSMLRTTDPDYKINNNYAPFYARKIMNEHEDLQNIFNLREQRY